MSRSREMARLTKELSQAAEFRRTEIDAMRDATRATLAECAEMRGEMARDYRARMQKFLSALSQDVARHKRATAHQMAEIQRFLGTMGKNVAVQRNAAMNAVARFRSARSRAASRSRSGLQHDVGNIMMQTADLRQAAADAVAQFASEHRKLARQQQAQLKAGRRKLRAITGKFMDNEHADRMKAHRIWSDFQLGMLGA
jgi:uncharacterized membrane-anchored protein YhcB (DUF1043 family)